MKKLTRAFRALGTNVRLTIYKERPELLLEAEQLIEHYEGLFSLHREDSEVCKINREAGVQPVKVSTATFELIEYGLVATKRELGFSILIGPLSQLWRIGFEDARRPSDEEIRALLPLMNPDEVELDSAEQTVFLKQKGMQVDLGGIAKGYIADRVADFFQAEGLEQAVVNLGASSIRFIGESPEHGDGLWRVGIKHPLLGAGRPVKIVKTGAGAVTTTGVTNRKLLTDGAVYHHLLDPKTGFPMRTNVLTATVLTSCALDGEVRAKQPLINKDFLDCKKLIIKSENGSLIINNTRNFN
ncbi:FAD:protein FMN transferase [Lactococcus termiticola]|uniref:FAD:protein FMN transferase n=1 Tax=Lactococcus termiticola TaxID=2169526 RepID=A0A2R5HH62_9LACT|nr:FAD:protein FMN transferase [Lactococcus termiticola]GBG97407.1 thiamine biosynthesis lipoprotein [Lactococcus termiticola]